MAINAAAAYHDSGVLTASPEELTLMLYNGAIKFCNLAMIAMEKNDVPSTNTNLIKAQKIILEFRHTLNTKYPVAQDFDIMYEYIYRRLVEANIHKDKEILEEATGLIRDMRDTWKEAIKLSKENA
jgi:flagellar protein FliS